jgi:osmoprotectant transport system permease protein
MSVLASGPVIPHYAQGTSCEIGDHWFCVGWVRAHWGDTLAPALVQHLELTAIAIGCGVAISFALTCIGFRFRLLDAPLGAFSDFLYTIPSLALFQLLVPVTGLTVTTVEIALVSYTLLILYRNIAEGLRGVPAEALDAARGMGLTPRQTFIRVQLPLAMPAFISGVRLATVSTISIATVAAFVVPKGLGHPIFVALRQNIYKTEIIAAGGLAVALALAADVSLTLAQRALTPWNRRQSA